MKRSLLLAVAILSGCGTSKSGHSPDYGAALALVGLGLIYSGISRAAGGCYAICNGMQVCNPSNGLCEPNPCGPGCGSGRRCDLHAPVPICVEDATADLMKRPPPTDPILKPLP
jgi:hypothetical protein